MKHAEPSITTHDAESVDVKRGKVGVHRFVCDFCRSNVTPAPDREVLGQALRVGKNFVSPMEDYYPAGWKEVRDFEHIEIMCPGCAESRLGRETRGGR